jgi:hypothetical protein
LESRQNRGGHGGPPLQVGVIRIDELRFGTHTSLSTHHSGPSLPHSLTPASSLPLSGHGRPMAHLRMVTSRTAAAWSPPAGASGQPAEGSKATAIGNGLRSVPIVDKTHACPAESEIFSRILFAARVAPGLPERSSRTNHCSAHPNFPGFRNHPGAT